ncbi:hypothetical protein CR513_05183, partial [Mucuna pruriens]
MMINTPLSIEYVEGDEEALETSFQALEIVGTTNVEAERGDLKPSKAAIMTAKVSITNETSLQINNATLAPDDVGKSSRQDEEEETEKETLKKLERLLEQERPKLQFGIEELKYENIFAWSYRDMTRLDTAIVEHMLPLILNAILVRQQLRRMKPKQLWNTPSGWPISCRSLRRTKSADVDLNRASPKDNFPLPHIDLLVDNTAQHSCYSFMDGFSRYNQI